MIAIHVGLKKSGSASIQTFLSVNENRLRELSIDYPRAGRLNGKAHNELAREIQGRTVADPKSSTLTQCAEYWCQAKSHVMVLSSEVFEEAECDEIARMRKVLVEARSEEEEFRIFLIIRNLIDLLPSSYAQKIKYGFHIYDFDSFFSERMRERRVHFADTAKRWADVFGWDSMRIRVLDRRHLVNGDLIDDFLVTLGVPAGELKALDLERTGIQNSAPGWRVLEAVRALFGNRHGLPEHHRLLDFVGQKPRKLLGRAAVKLGELRSWNTDKGHYLTREQAQLCLDVYRTSIALLNEYVSDKLPMPEELGSGEFHERNFMPDVTQIPNRELLEFYESLLHLLMKRQSKF